MTIPSTARKAGPLLGNGSQTAWPFTFRVFSAGDVAVTIANAIGVETLLVLDTDYSVALNPNQNTTPGGTVTYPISGTPLATGSVLTITGDVDYDQPLAVPTGGNFNPTTMERQLDRMVMQIQQLREELSRALKIGVTSDASTALPAPVANNIIGWNSGGNALENTPLTELATAVAFATYRYDTFLGDGVEDTFVLSADPVTLGNIDVSVDGITYVPGVNHTLTGTSLVFTNPPADGAEILARYGQALPPSALGSASDVTYTPAGTGAVARTVEAKLRGDVAVTPEDKGAVGDGVADDTTALVNAIASGQNVRLTEGKVYRFTSDLELTTNFQCFGGPGQLKPDGNCGVVIKSGAVGVCVNVVVNSATHTGVAVKVDGAHRSRISLYAVDCYDGVYITGANVASIDWMWGACRNKGITWYGTTGVRSDILHIKFAVFSVGAGRYGLDWDGNCHSLEVDYLGIVCGSGVSAGNGYGAVVRNTSGGTAPAIGKFNHIEIDYSGTHGLDIQVGSDYDISMPYILGATGAGIRVGAGINNFEVRVLGGKSRGNTTYGIQALGGVVLFGGATDLSGNTTAETIGTVWTRSPRFAVDTTHHISNLAGNPLHTWDTNDYTGYDRTNNVLADFIGGTAVLSRSAARLTAGVPMRLPTYTVAGLPAVSVAGDMAFATNGRKNGEGGGLGTGVLVFSDGTAWRACDTGATVAA
jgi:hypothetical protein